MSNIRLSEDMIGKEVRLVKIINSYNPDKIGAIGSIVNYDEEDKDNMHYLVNWNFNGHEWETWPNDEEIEEVVANKDVKDNKEMTNEEIWKMLESKMRKNGLISKVNLVHISPDNYPNNEVKIKKTYLEDDVHNAIALAYKVGYLRAMKGRPFKFDKKKKGGHWEPVDPNNLPKEGTRVRYSRKFDDNIYNTFENRTNMKIGEETVVMYGNFGDFGIKPIHGIREWWCSSSYPDRFDIWVEDDE